MVEIFLRLISSLVFDNTEFIRKASISLIGLNQVLATTLAASFRLQKYTKNELSHRPNCHTSSSTWRAYHTLMHANWHCGPYLNYLSYQVPSVQSAMPPRPLWVGIQAGFWCTVKQWSSPSRSFGQLRAQLLLGGQVCQSDYDAYVLAFWSLLISLSEVYLQDSLHATLYNFLVEWYLRCLCIFSLLW